MLGTTYNSSSRVLYCILYLLQHTAFYDGVQKMDQGELRCNENLIRNSSATIVMGSFGLFLFTGEVTESTRRLLPEVDLKMTSSVPLSN